ncbi:hypothetical protein, partial [Neisseria lactamica]|uniref:hypothetical protein n=1 Tax=Neisseria lactamica TaxID=486 RepID=UPI001EDD2782
NLAKPAGEAVTLGAQQRDLNLCCSVVVIWCANGWAVISQFKKLTTAAAPAAIKTVDFRKSLFWAYFRVIARFSFG